MLRTLLFVPIITVGYFFLWPLFDYVQKKAKAGLTPLETALSALMLSLGLLAFVLYIVGILPANLISRLSVAVVVMAGAILGVVLNRYWFDPARWWEYWQAVIRRQIRFEPVSLLTWAILGSGLVILINDLYYPFIGDDTLVRYAPQAQTIYRLNAIPQSIWGYPPLAPLTFVSSWLVAGAQDEHLARLFPALMAFGTLGATYITGRLAHSRRAGIVAAALVALTPMFVNNATLAYIDIPTAFPLTMMVFFVLRWWTSGKSFDSIMAGVALGISLLTKQSAFTWLVLAVVTPALWVIGAYRAGQHMGLWRRTAIGFAGLLIPAILISGPWYFRNAVIGLGQVILVAGKYHQLSYSTGWLGIIPPIAWTDTFGFALSIVEAVGWAIGFILAGKQAISLVQGKIRDPLPADLILAIAIVPYWLAWWTSFSFDARFLLLILPLMAVWAARPALWIAGVLSERLHPPRVLWQFVALLGLSYLLYTAASDRLGGVYYAVTQPLASDDTKMIRVKGTMYSLVQYALENFDPAKDRLWLMDERMAYYLEDYQINIGYPLLMSDLEGYDYIIHSSSFYGLYRGGILTGWAESEYIQRAFSPLFFEKVYEINGVHIMRILTTDVSVEEEFEPDNSGTAP